MWLLNTFVLLSEWSPNPPITHRTQGNVLPLWTPSGGRPPTVDTFREQKWHFNTHHSPVPRVAALQIQCQAPTWHRWSYNMLPDTRVLSHTEVAFKPTPQGEGARGLRGGPMAPTTRTSVPPLWAAEAIPLATTTPPSVAT